MPPPLITTLTIPTNPDYDRADVGFDPEKDGNEFRYWNPVGASNELVTLANAALEVGRGFSDALQERADLKLAKKQAQRALERFEKELLIGDDLTPTEAKSNKTIEAAILRRAKHTGTLGEYEALQAAVTEPDDRLEIVQGQIDTLDMWTKVNERTSNNLTNALSFYKDERKRAYQH